MPSESLRRRVRINPGLDVDLSPIETNAAPTESMMLAGEVSEAQSPDAG
jgi:hypothetical protein